MDSLPDVLAGADIPAMLAQAPGKPIYQLLALEEGQPRLGPVPVGEMLAGYEQGGERYYLCLLDAYINPRSCVLEPILELSQEQEWRLSRFALRPNQGTLPPVHMVFSDIPAEESAEDMAPDEVERAVVLDEVPAEDDSIVYDEVVLEE